MVSPDYKGFPAIFQVIMLPGVRETVAAYDGQLLVEKVILVLQSSHKDLRVVFYVGFGERGPVSINLFTARAIFGIVDV
jgi:hypothetical protein